MISIERILQLVKESNKYVGKRPSLLEGLVCSEKDALIKKAGSPAHYYRFLYFLMKETKFKIVVELGTSYGISSACLADGNSEARVITIDSQSVLRKEAKRTNVEYYIQDSLILPKKEVNNIDLLFIDTAHDGSRCDYEYLLYEPLLAKNSLVFFDDVYVNADMHSFWEDFRADGVKIDLPVHGNAGFGMIYRKGGFE